MTLDSYIQFLRGKSIAVIGLGVSNRPLLRLLLDAGYTVTVRDKRTREALGEDEAAWSISLMEGSTKSQTPGRTCRSPTSRR